MNAKELTDRFRKIRASDGLTHCSECGWFVTNDDECNMCGAEL